MEACVRFLDQLRHGISPASAVCSGKRMTIAFLVTDCHNSVRFDLRILFLYVVMLFILTNRMRETCYRNICDPGSTVDRLKFDSSSETIVAIMCHRQSLLIGFF